MEPTNFVAKLKEHVVERDHAVYREILDSAEGVQDPLWKAAVPIYRGLNRSDRQTFLRLLRLVQVNALSHVLGILDGSTSMDVGYIDFVLTTAEDDTVLNGSLQDMFLEMEEG